MCKFRHIDGGFLRWSAKCIAKRFRPLVRTLPGDEYGNRLNRYIIIIILVLLTCGPEQPAPETRAQFARAQALYRNRHFDESLAALQPVRAATEGSIWIGTNPPSLARLGRPPATRR